MVAVKSKKQNTRKNRVRQAITEKYLKVRVCFCEVACDRHPTIATFYLHKLAQVMGMIPVSIKNCHLGKIKERK